MSLKQIPISKIYSLPTEPLNKVEGRFWFNTDTTSVSGGKLYRCDGTNWVPVNVGSDYVTVKLPDNSTPISLTTYLNNQISALSEGISEVESEVNNQKNEFNDKVAELQISKANSGALHFGINSYANKTPTTTLSTANVVRSFMFRIVGFDWKANTAQSYITNFLQFGGNGGYNGFWLGYYGGYMSLMCAHNGNRGVICSVGYQTYFPLLKDSVNDICVVFKTDADSNVSGTIYFNGQAVATTSYERVFDVFQDAYRLNAPDATKAFTYKDVCVFNFDITAENAPYSINDYLQNKPIPPYLLMGSGERFNIVNAVENTDYALGQYGCTATFTETDGVYTIGKTDKVEGAASYQAYFFIKPSSTIKAGSLVKVNLKRSGTSCAWRIGFAPRYGDVTSTNEVEYLYLGENYWDGDVLKNDTVIPPVDCNGVCIRVANSYESFSFKELSIEVNGAELALENYTFNGKVLDYSGNANNASITGVVKGDNDSSIDVFTSQLSTGSSDSSDILNTVFTTLSTNNNGNIVDASNVYYEVPGYSGNVEEWLYTSNSAIHDLIYQVLQIGDQGSGVKYRNEDDYLTVNEGFSNVKAEIDSLSSQLSNSSSNSTLTNLPVYNLDGSLAGESKGIQITKTASGNYTLEIITSSGEVNGDGTIPSQPVYDETGNIIAGENKTLRIVKADGAYTIEIV